MDSIQYSQSKTFENCSGCFLMKQNTGSDYRGHHNKLQQGVQQNICYLGANVNVYVKNWEMLIKNTFKWL